MDKYYNKEMGLKFDEYAQIFPFNERINFYENRISSGSEQFNCPDRIVFDGDFLLPDGNSRWDRDAAPTMLDAYVSHNSGVLRDLVPNDIIQAMTVLRGDILLVCSVSVWKYLLELMKMFNQKETPHPIEFFKLDSYYTSLYCPEDVIYLINLADPDIVIPSLHGKLRDLMIS